MPHTEIAEGPYRPWQVYVMVALCLVAGPWIFYLWNQHWQRVIPGIDNWEPNAALAATTDSIMHARAAGEPITDTLILLATHDKKSLAGQRIQLDQVGVRWTLGNGGFAVSQLSIQPVFVLAPNARNIAPGEAVSLSGTIQPMLNRDELRKRWPGLSDRLLAELQSDGLYILADSVVTLGRY